MAKLKQTTQVLMQLIPIAWYKKEQTEQRHWHPAFFSTDSRSFFDTLSDKARTDTKTRQCGVVHCINRLHLQ